MRTAAIIASRRGGGVPSARLRKLLILLIRSRPVGIGVALFLILVSGLFEGVGVLTLLPLLDVAISESASSPDGAAEIYVDVLSDVGLQPTIGMLVGIVIGGITMKAIFFLFAVRQVGYLAADIVAQLRLDLLRALVSVRWQFLVEQRTGSLTNALGTETVRVQSMIQESAFLGANIMQVLVYLVLAVMVSWTVTVGGAVFGLVFFVTLTFAVRIARRAGHRETALYRSLMDQLTDALGSIKPLKAMAREDALVSVVEDDVNELRVTQKRQIVSRALGVSVHEPLVALFLGLGAYVALTRGIPMARLIFLALIFQRIVTRIGNVHTYYQSTLIQESAFWSLQNLISAAQEQGETSSGQDAPDLVKGIAFRNVRFSYGPHVVLHDFFLDIPAGSFTAIAGPSGAGKTTIADLMVGLVSPDRGDVLVDEQSLTQIDIRKWRRKIGYVAQDVTLLNESVLVNITLRDPALTEEDVIEALDAAGASPFVFDRSEGIHSLLGERGASLSGGQRQRIAIARALVHRPRLLILDEATTGLDPETERAILSSLRQLRGRLTIVGISHQPAVVEAADYVVNVTPQEIP